MLLKSLPFGAAVFFSGTAIMTCLLSCCQVRCLLFSLLPAGAARRASPFGHCFSAAKPTILTLPRSPVNCRAKQFFDLISDDFAALWLLLTLACSARAALKQPHQHLLRSSKARDCTTQISMVQASSGIELWEPQAPRACAGLRMKKLPRTAGQSLAHSKRAQRSLRASALIPW
jgi:hypothetical protein